MKRVIAITLALVLCVGCTIHRKEVRQREASFSSTGQDSGILVDKSAEKTGFVVNQEWLAGYDNLLARFGKRLTPPRKTGDRSGIVKEQDHYRIGDEVMERMLVMNQMRVDDAP